MCESEVNSRRLVQMQNFSNRERETTVCRKSRVHAGFGQSVYGADAVLIRSAFGADGLCTTHSQEMQRSSPHLFRVGGWVVGVTRGASSGEQWEIFEASIADVWSFRASLNQLTTGSMTLLKGLRELTVGKLSS